MQQIDQRGRCRMANTKGNKTKKKNQKRTASGRTKVKTMSAKKNTARKKKTDVLSAKSTEKMIPRTSGDAAVLRRQEGIPMSDEIGLVLSFGLMILMMFSNFGFCGMLGMWLSSFFFGIFGVAQYVMPLAFFAGMTILLANDYSNLAMKKCGAGFIMLMTISGFAQLMYPDKNVAVSEVFSLSVNHRECGGIIGGGIALTLRSGFGTAGAAIILICLFLLSSILLTQRSLAGFYMKVVEYVNLFRADQKVKRAQRSEERRQRREEEAALERELLVLTQAAEAESEFEQEDEEEPYQGSSGTGGPGHHRPRRRKKRELFSVFRRASRKSDHSGSPVDDKVIELEELRKMRTSSPLHFDSRTADTKKKAVPDQPVFESTDRPLRKDSVRELHPQAYPFSPEDGKTAPFTGELDYSAFRHYDRSGLDKYIEKSLKGQKEQEFSGTPQFSRSSQINEIRIHNMYDEEDQTLEETSSSVKMSEKTSPASSALKNSDAAVASTVQEGNSLQSDLPLQEPLQEKTVTVAENAVEARRFETSRQPEESRQEAETGHTSESRQEAETGHTSESRQPAESHQDSEEESSFRIMDAVTDETGFPVPGQALEKVAMEVKDRPSVPSGQLVKEEKKASERNASGPSGQLGQEAAIRINRAAEPKALSEKQTEKKEGKKKEKKAYVFPPVSLLVREEQSFPPDHDRILKETALKLQETLKSFGVNVTITDISCGPTVTRYEMVPEQGTKVSKIVALTDDIKLNLAAADIRIEAPIPGKSAIGIEVPNKHVQIVHFRNLIDNRTFKKFKSRLAFAVGKDIGGKIVVTDLAKMPHLLIAGATGSGKSVCINTLIMSLIYKASPEEVRLIMIDPKMVELSVYNGLPHLLIPVVTDPKKASGALNWAVSEMTERYRRFSETGVRNIEGYNKKVKDLIASGKVPEGELERMSQIVIIIDELADLMMVSPGEVEDAIVRLSQLARAAGIHLVIATQRPSVNVITGLIKANVPSRIAFAVSSGVDSRTILDMNGAEKLLGKGDMLFYPAGLQKPVRVQGAFITDEEISNVVDFIKEKSGSSDYDSSVADRIEKKIQSGSSSQDRDEYFEAAARFIMEKDKATIGMLQRMFKIGFNRAARIIDQLADAGIIGPEEGTKPRKILMSPEQLDQYFEECL